MGYIIFIIIGFITIIYALLRSASKVSRTEKMLYAEKKFREQIAEDRKERGI